jgi:putative SOS response-associated peptidase YedK
MTEANELMSRIHPRMPIILRSNDYERWLDREEAEQLPLYLLRAHLNQKRWKRIRQIPKVNNVRNHGPELPQQPERAAASGPFPL